MQQVQQMVLCRCRERMDHLRHWGPHTQRRLLSVYAEQDRLKMIMLAAAERALCSLDTTQQHKHTAIQECLNGVLIHWGKLVEETLPRQQMEVDTAVALDSIHQTTYSDHCKIGFQHAHLFDDLRHNLSVD